MDFVKVPRTWISRSEHDLAAFSKRTSINKRGNQAPHDRNYPALTNPLR